MGSFWIVAAVLSVGTALGLKHTWRSVRTLRGVSVSELSHLKSALSGRHLVVSHLLDSLPRSFDTRFERDRLQNTCGEAASALEAICAESPKPTEIAESTRQEEELYWLVEDLVKKVGSDEEVSGIEPVAACLLGLEESNRKIKHAISTYNSSAITYQNFRQRPITALVARWIPDGKFALFDMNLDSRDSRG